LDKELPKKALPVPQVVQDTPDWGDFESEFSPEILDTPAKSRSAQQVKDSLSDDSSSLTIVDSQLALLVSDDAAKTRSPIKIGSPTKSASKLEPKSPKQVSSDSRVVRNTTSSLVATKVEKSKKSDGERRKSSAKLSLFSKSDKESSKKRVEQVPDSEDEKKPKKTLSPTKRKRPILDSPEEGDKETDVPPAKRARHEVPDSDDEETYKTTHTKKQTLKPPEEVSGALESPSPASRIKSLKRRLDFAAMSQGGEYVSWCFYSHS
jgi:hypothetical protein